MQPRQLAQRPRILAVLMCALALMLLASCSTTPAASSASAASSPSLASSSSQQPSPTEAATPSPSESQAEVGLSGTWSGTWKIDAPYSGSGGWTMKITQNGNKFHGTVDLTKTDCSDGTVDGNVDGSTLSFGWIVTPQPIHFEGQVNGTSMSGTWSAKACSDSKISLTGTWKGTKQH
jgi:hypothetical protein